MISALAYDGDFGSDWEQVLPAEGRNDVSPKIYDDLVGRRDSKGIVYIRDKKEKREYAFTKMPGVCALGTMTVRGF